MSIANELIVRGHNRDEFEGVDGSVCLYGAAWMAAGRDWDAYGVACQVIEDLIGFERVVVFNRERTYDEVLRLAKEADEILGAS